MNQKRFTNIVLGIIIVITVSTVGYFTFVKKSGLITNKSTSIPTSTSTLLPPPPLSSHNVTWDKSKEYFYYVKGDPDYENKEIPLKFVGIKDGFPVFKGQNSEGELLLSDEFITKFKKGTTQEEIRVLNNQYNVSIVKPMYGMDDQFVLTVKANPQINALNMANMYHNESIIEWAEPNFILLLPGPHL